MLLVVVHLLLLLIYRAVANFVDEAPVKIGFVFVLTTQRQFGLFQQVSIWEAYFRNVPKSRYATVAVNWPFEEPLPSFISTDYSHETDYGGTRYVETYLAASKLLIERFNVSGTILLSGSCLPLRPFDQFYQLIAPHLFSSQSILRVYPATEVYHAARYAKLKNPRISKKEWMVHPAQGYIIHSSALRLIFRSWRSFVTDLQGIESIDEHYITYILLSLAQKSGRLGTMAKSIHENLVQKHLMYTEWQKKHPRIWTQNLTRNEVDRIRSSFETACFLRKVSRTCNVDPLIVEP